MSTMAYSRVSRFAVVSAICGISTALGLVAPELAVTAVGGVATGLAALCEIRKYEFCGSRLARLGLATSIAFALATPLWHFARFNLESLPGYMRLDFAVVTKEGTNSLEPFSGKNICLKGYALLPTSTRDPDRFVFSPNGDQRRTENAILVKLNSGETWQWISDSLAVSGTLAANPEALRDPSLPRFVLKDATVRFSYTPYGLKNRVPGEGC